MRRCPRRTLGHATGAVHDNACIVAVGALGKEEQGRATCLSGEKDRHGERDWRSAGEEHDGGSWPLPYELAEVERFPERHHQRPAARPALRRAWRE